MPFPLKEDPIPLSNKDVLSYIFDDPTYPEDKPVLIDPEAPTERYFSLSRARLLVKHLIAGFVASGLKPGDTVCVHAFNSIWYPLFVLGVIGAGGVCVSTNPGYTALELRHALSVAKVSYILSEPGDVLKNIVRAMKECGLDVDSHLWVLNFEHDTTDISNLLGRNKELDVDYKNGNSASYQHKFRSWRCLVQYGEKNWTRFDDEQTSANTVAQLYYTSGTTGLPKCAMTTHRNLVAQHQIYFEANPRSYAYKMVLCMPAFHIGASGQYIVSSLKQGRDAYVMRRFELESFLKYNAKYQCTEVFVVPPMVKAVVMSGYADPSSSKYREQFGLKSVRNGTTGAAPCSGDLQQRFNKLLGEGATFTQVWGMTETTSMATMVPKELAVECSRGNSKYNIWASVGKPLSHITLKLIDEVGRDVTATIKRGQICVKGPTVVKGYFENETATRESWDDEGYFKTGDIAEVDETHEGLLYLVERLKELIKVRGFQCAPAELEGALTELPDITDAAVIGVSRRAQTNIDRSGNTAADMTSNDHDNHDGGEVEEGEDEDEDEEYPKAFIVLKPESTLTTKQIHAFMQKRLAKYKQLTGGIEFVDSIPKLPSGKILKRLLRDREKEKEKQFTQSKPSKRGKGKRRRGRERAKL